MDRDLSPLTTPDSLAADLRHDRRVAIKVLKPELSAVLAAVGPDRLLFLFTRPVMSRSTDF